MNHKRSNLMTIGVFASHTRLSVKALRLYDELSILKPAYTDNTSGYRYYHLEQVHTARLIRMMRLMDMPLALIREVLDTSPDVSEQLIQDYWEDMQQRMILAGQVVHTLIRTLKGEVTTMPFEVKVKTVPQQNIISITRHVKVNQLDTLIGELKRELMQVASAQDVSFGTPFGYYHGEINHESDGPIEVCLPTDTLITETGDGIEAREVPEARVAYVDTHEQDCFFPHILKGYDTVFDWIRQNGYEHVGSPHEVWHSLDKPRHIEVAMEFSEPQ